MSDGTPYRDAALAYMLGKLDSLVERVGIAHDTSDGIKGLLPQDVQTIEAEIRLQHEAQCDKNQTSFDRLASLYIANPLSFGEWKAMFVKTTRSVDADTVQRLCLLDWYPEMGSIEDLKRTCLADYGAYEQARKGYINNLQGLSSRSGGRFIVQVIATEDLQPRPRDLKDIAPDQVEAEKTTIAHITDNISHQIYEVVEKFSQYRFPETQVLEGVRPHVVDGVNKQPLYLQMYLTTETSQEHHAVDGEVHDPLYVGRAGLTRQAWEARKAKEAQKAA